MSTRQSTDTTKKSNNISPTTINTIALTAAISVIGIASIFFPFTTVIGCTFLFGAGAGIIVSGVQGASSSSDKIKNTISKLNETNKKMSEQLKNANKQIIDLTDETKQEYENLLSEYINMKNDIVNNSLDFSKELKNIQVRGILVVVFIFFLLILKQFGLIETLFYILSYPFMYIYNSLVKIFKK
jgi:predicted PurR-regulated permease PerM